MKESIPIEYCEMRHKIRDADLLLFRRRDRLARLISVAGRSQYVHAAMAGWWNDRLMCVEMTSGGGRAQLLSNLVARWPGVIDVYAIQEGRGTRETFSRQRALTAMIGITGIRYGWVNLVRAALLHLPLVRFLVRPEENDAGGNESRNSESKVPHALPPFCSQAVSASMRAGGMDPVPNLADRLTEPGDLARSAICQYCCTLT
jgi:hypothetical protein